MSEKTADTAEAGFFNNVMVKVPSQFASLESKKVRSPAPGQKGSELTNWWVDLTRESEQ